MLNLLSAVLYLGRDLLKCACLLFAERKVFSWPQKRRLPLWAAFFLLLAANAAAAVFLTALPDEDRRALADVLSFLLCAAIPVSAVEKPGKRAGKLLAAALLLDFTADTLYSLVSSAFSDALWFESAFGAAFYALLLGFLVFAQKKQDVTFLRGAFRCIPRGAWAALFFFEFTCYYRAFGEALSWYRVFSAVSVVSVVFTLFYLIFRLLYFAEQQNRILRQFSMQKDYETQLLRSDEELRAFRHDYKNHMIAVNAFLENGDLKAAKAYLDGIARLSGQGMRRFSTGRFAADAVISCKYGAAEEKGVRIDFQGRIPEGTLRDEDLCTILFNLLDNAVDAAAPLPGEKEVHIDAVSKNGFFLLCVTNPEGGGVTRKGTLPKTTKADKKNHGYGLKNVKRTVEKYNGSFRVDREDNLFSATVRFQI